jgi:hypothetical protein
MLTCIGYAYIKSSKWSSSSPTPCWSRGDRQGWKGMPMYMNRKEMIDNWISFSKQNQHVSKCKNVEITIYSWFHRYVFIKIFILKWVILSYICIVYVLNGSKMLKNKQAIKSLTDNINSSWHTPQAPKEIFEWQWRRTWPWVIIIQTLKFIT